TTTPKPQAPVAAVQEPKTAPPKPAETPKVETRALKIETAPAEIITALPAEPLAEAPAPAVPAAPAEPAAPRQTQASKAERINRGKNLAIVCEACHGVQGRSANPSTPKLAGQHADYLSKQLRDFKSKRRSDAVMSSIAESLSDQDMRDVAEYFAAQKRN
ncbi:MAG: cytochrome c, partial [Pseudomonadota bacterium]